MNSNFVKGITKIQQNDFGLTVFNSSSINLNQRWPAGVNLTSWNLWRRNQGMTSTQDIPCYYLTLY